MKRLLTMIALVSLFDAVAPVMGQATYTWVGSIDTSWNKGNNWAPPRGTSLITDILVFDGAQVRQPTLTSLDTVSKVSVTGNTTLTITIANNKDKSLAVIGGTPSAFSVGSGVNLTIDGVGTTTFNGQVIIGSGGGSVSGSVTLLGRGQLLCTDAVNQLAFVSGAVCNSSLSGGNPFGASTSTPNSVRFLSGSAFNHNSGGDPFAAAPPASIVIFDAGSMYNFNFTSAAGTSISLVGRTYPNVLFAGANGFIYNYPVSGTLNGVINGTLTVNSTIILAPPSAGTYSGQILVSGNIVNNGSWSTSTNRVSLNGTSAQTLSGSGITALGKGLIINNSAGVSVQQALTVSDSLLFTSGNLILGSSVLTLRGQVSGAAAGKCIVTNGSGSVVDSIAGNTSFVFPVSPNTTDFNPLTITLNPGDPAESFAVRIAGGVAPVMPNNATAVGRTWTITEGTPGGNNAVLTFQWSGAQEGASFVRNFATAWKNDGVKWAEVSKGALAGTDPFTFTTSTPVTGFSPFAIANSLPGLTIIPPAMDLGAVLVGASKSDSAKIKNPGTSPLIITAVTSSDTAFTVTPSNGTVAAGDSLWVHVTFRAHAITAKNDTIIFTSNSPKGKDTLFVAAHGTGIEVETPITGPKDFAVSPNSPNPFNAITSIRYTVPENAFVTLRIYDVSGREVTTLVDRVVAPGRYSANWNGRSGNGARLSSGAYFCRMEAGPLRGVSVFVRTLQMMVQQ